MAGPESTSCQELANPEDVENVVQRVQTSMSLLQDNLTSTSIEGDRNQVFQGCTFNVACQQTGATDSSAEKRKMQGTETKETPGKKTQLVTELKNKYSFWCGETKPAPFLHDNYDLDDLFVPTGVQYLQDKHGEEKKWTTLKGYKTVFTDPQVKSKRRIITGGPGYGKSTLALQIAKDWCDGVNPLNQYDIVILLRLRQFKNVPTVYSAIKRFLLPKDTTLTEDDIKNILDSSSTLVVLDGYDEYPDREKEDTDVNHIIKGDMFQEHEVVVTTRTSCLPPTYTNTTIKRLRVTGFDDDSRETYVRKAVSRGISDVADKIITFLHVNPVPADLSKIPLFLAMLSFMVKISENFRNLTTVTNVFRHIIRCFHSHRDIKTTGATPGKLKDHSKLDKVAFEGLNGDKQHISWGKDNLMGKIGKDLYDEYVSIGILIEEESFNYDILEYNTETRFFHKLFAEWYAAHHFAKVASRPETEFEPWPKRRCLRGTVSYHTEADSLAPSVAVNPNNVQFLRHLNPYDVHYLYRYACGLNSEAAVKIIKHLATKGAYDEYALLCRTEWGGSFEEIQDTASSLCFRGIHINQSDSLLLQQSTIALLEFAASRKIQISMVSMNECLFIDSKGNLCVQPSNKSLPVNGASINVLRISERWFRVITEEETDTIFQYAAKCLKLKRLQFDQCLLPPYLKKLTPRTFTVENLSPYGNYLLKCSSCQWEPRKTHSEKTDEQMKKWEEEFRRWTEDENSNYKRLKNDISTLPTDDCKKLAEFFSMSNKMDAILSSEQPARKLLFFLEEKGIIHPSNISRLEQAFSELAINAPCYSKIVNYQRHIMEISSYDRLIADLSLHITHKIRDLCKYFNFTDETTTRIIASPNSGLSLLMELDTKSVISATDVGALTDPFKKCQLVQAAAKIQEYQSKLTKEDDILQTAPNLTMKDSKRLLFIQYLKKKMRYWYETMTPVPWKRSCKWRSTDLYVGNWLIFKDSQTISCHIDKKCKLKHREMFSHVRLATAKRIIVEGEPGCGKTMLTAQLAYDWSEGVISDVDILVLLPLKFVGNKSLVESIKEFYIPSQAPLDENDIEEILSSTTDTIGVLLDGLEEYSYHGSSEVAKVFKENKHPNWKVVLTSRSNCATDLPTFPRLQIDVFGEEERNKYIENLFKDDKDMQMKTKAAISDSAFVGDLCTVPLLFVLAVHSMEDDRSLEKDDYEKTGTFVRSMISKLTAEYDVHTEIDGPNINQSTNTMSYLGEFAFNGLKSDQQQLGWQRNFLEDNVGNCKQWIDSGILVIEEEFATIAKDEKQNEAVNVKTEDAVSQEYVADEEVAFNGLKSDQQQSIDSGILVIEEEFATITKDEKQNEAGNVKVEDAVPQTYVSDEDEAKRQKINDTPANQSSSKDVSKESSTSTADTVKHVPQMVKFLHKVIQEWFAAAYFSTMLKNCTNRDEYDEYVSAQLPHISPTDLHYLLRFTCFFHPSFCHTIINHLLRRHRLNNEIVPSYIMDCICLCFAEQRGVKDSEMEEVVAKVCTEIVAIHSEDSPFLQRAKYTLLEYASKSMITIEQVRLTDVVINVKNNGLILNSGLKFHVLETARMVEVSRWDLMLTKCHYENIMEVLSTGTDVKEIICAFPDPPPNSLMDKTRAHLCARKITVKWIIGGTVHLYDPSEGKWQITTKDQMTSHESESEKKIETEQLLGTRKVFSKRRCVLTITGTNVELHIPPNAFQESEEHTVTMRILPNDVMVQQKQCFEDYSTAVVEIASNKPTIFQSPVKLVLPHCLKIRNPRYSDVQVFKKHNVPGQQQDWKNITESVSYSLFHDRCEIWMKSFCWVTYTVPGKNVEAKKIKVYATGDGGEGKDSTIVRVGYYLNTAGGREIFNENRKTYVVTQFFTFYKEPATNLDIKLTKIKPHMWEVEETTKRKQVIKYEKVYTSTEKYQDFCLERKGSTNSNAPLELCCFEVSKGAECVHLSLELPTTHNPQPAQNDPQAINDETMDEVVANKVLLELAPKLGEDWKFVGRRLGLEEDVINNISSNNVNNQKEKAYQMLRQWKKRKGRKATYKILERALKKVNRVDLMEAVKHMRDAK